MAISAGSVVLGKPPLLLTSHALVSRRRRRRMHLPSLPPPHALAVASTATCTCRRFHSSRRFVVESVAHNTAAPMHSRCGWPRVERFKPSPLSR